MINISKYVGLLVILLSLSFSVGCSDIIDKLPFPKSDEKKDEKSKYHGKLDPIPDKKEIKKPDNFNKGTNSDEAGGSPLVPNGDTVNSTDVGESSETLEPDKKKKTEAPDDKNILNKGDSTPPPKGNGDLQKQEEEPKPVVPADKDKTDKDKVDKDKTDKEKADKDKTDKNKVDKDKTDKEKAKKDDNSTKDNETAGTNNSDTGTNVITGGEDVAILSIGSGKPTDRANTSNKVFIDEYEYNPRKKRNPFKPHNVVEKIETEPKKPIAELTPLEKTNTSQLIVKAIIYDSKTDTGVAMVEIRSDRKKRGFNIYVGTKVKNGKVVSITPNEVRVEIEHTSKYNSKKTIETLKLSKPKKSFEVKMKKK